MWWRVAGFVSQLGASAEDCLWVVAVAELVFCMVAIYPRSSLSFKSSASPLLQMVAFKLLAVDGLRIAAEVSSGILPCWVNVSRRRVRLLGTCGSPHPHLLPYVFVFASGRACLGGEATPLFHGASGPIRAHAD